MPLLLPRSIRPPDGGTGQNPQTTAGLLALAPPGRLYSVNPLVSYQGDPATGWRGGQVMENCILLDPHDSSRYLIYFCGQGHGGTGGYVARATAPASDPLGWTLDPTPLFGGGNRLDSVVYDPVNDLILAYSTVDTSANYIELWTSPGTDGLNFTLYGTVFQASECTESGTTDVSQGAVWRQDATHWFMVYSHRGSYGTLPDLRLATSSDGKTWTDTGTTVWAKGAAGSYDSTYKEWHQLQQMPDGNFLLVAECYDDTQWRIGAATSPTVNAAFTPLANPIFSGSGVARTFDEVHVATPSIYNLNNEWYLFYQGCSAPTGGQNYSAGYWSTGAARF